MAAKDNVETIRRTATQKERTWVKSQFALAVGVPYEQCLTAAYNILLRDYSPWAYDSSYWDNIKSLKHDTDTEADNQEAEEANPDETEESAAYEEAGAEQTEEDEYAQCLALDGRLKDSSNILRGLTRDQCKAYWLVMHTDMYDDKDLRDTAYTICLCSLRYYLLLMSHRHLIHTETDKDEFLQSFFQKIVMGPITETYDYKFSNIHTFVIRFCQRQVVKDVIGKDVKDSHLSASETDLLYQINRARRELRDGGVDSPSAEQISAHLSVSGQNVSTLQIRRAMAASKTTEALSDNTAAHSIDVTSQLHNRDLLTAISEYKNTMLTPLEQACYDFTLLDRQEQMPETIEQYIARVMPSQPVLKTQLERARRTASQKMDQYIRRLKGDKGDDAEIKAKKTDNEAESLSKIMAGLSAEELDDLFDT